MEKIKVNMSPNPLDVQTIHASQNDGEARQWEFELHNNGELIDTSEITEQMVFKAYKGGTEQILPENGSVPTTSPIIADIKYPQGELTDQEFTYRESPTEEDGLAKITDIKGNTLVWNQLNQNGNYPSTSGLSTWGCTISASNNILTFKATSHSGNYAHPFLNLVSGHKYLVGVTIQKEKAGELIRYGFEYGYNRIFVADNITTKKRYYQIVESTYTGSAKLYIASATSPSYTDFGNVYVSDYVCFDLTQMGLDITDPSDFTSLFPLSYYAYNQGSLLSFMGNGIKTTGKNQCNADDVQVGKAWNNASSSARAVLFAPIRPNTQYTVSITSLGTVEGVFIVEESEIGIINGISASLDNSTKLFTFTSRSNTKYIALQCNKTAITKSDFESVKFMVEHGTSASSYEPYISSIADLPISTYFPTGMKSAGSVYDELTETKATTRIGAVDMGTLNYSNQESVTTGRFDIDNLSLKAIGISNVLCAKYKTLTYVTAEDKSIRGSNANSNVVVIDSSFAGYTTEQVKSALSGVYLYYELANPTETTFTTASLVTENAEIPLSNEDGTLIGKCTEQLSENPGFIDAKIKLSDADGECYSNKLQLHVERSPQ